MIEEFLNYLKYEKNRSDKTIEAYGNDLREFETYFEHLEGQLSWESVDSDVIRGWMESMMDRGNAATSVNRRLCAVRSLYRFALSRQMVKRDPSVIVVGPKKDKPLPQFIREKDMDRLFDDMEWGDSYSDILTRTLLILLYETGIRLAELVGLDDIDVDLANRQLKVTGKRNKQRIIPFGEELAAELSRYIEKRNSEVERDSDALLVTKTGKRISRKTVYSRVKDGLSRVTSMKKRSPHVLRHSFATAMLNNEAGLESIRKLLGHESVATTEIYTHTTFEQLKKEYSKAHPRA